MRFEKLEQRCVMDGAGIGGFCSAMDTPVFSNSIQIEHVDYGPINPAEALVAEGSSPVDEEIHMFEPRATLDHGGPVEEVPQLNVNGAVLVGKQDVPTTTGLRAALDILEANGGYTQEWAQAGIETVYHSGNTYYFEFETPYEESLVLDSRALLVDIGLGTIYGFSRW